MVSYILIIVTLTIGHCRYGNNVRVLVKLQLQYSQLQLANT